VKAMNAAGATTAGVLIIVNGTGSASLYPSPFYAFTVGEGGVDYVAARPTIYGGFPISQGYVPNVTWAVSPALPPGLTFSKTDGSISGIPTAGTAAAGYTVKATNAGGSYSTTLTIAVSPLCAPAALAAFAGRPDCTPRQRPQPAPLRLAW
jgi:hypothetical protein